MANNRRRDILRRAAELFASQGVSRTSIEDIAAAVGIKREGVYYYFKSRSDILLEIILPQSKSLLMGLQRLMRANMDSTLKLRSAIEIHLDAYNPSYIEMSVALKEQHFGLDDTRMNELRMVWDEYGMLWTGIIREGQARGAFKQEIDAKIVAYGLLGMCNWVSRWYDPDKSTTIRDITDTFAAIATTGVEAAAVAKPEAAQ
ncbi:MAG: TetR/AcrR family transcriptional regulator [Xanthobacteraceae bacterium]|nr:MAG: TetR/AcrR family transcriptional regulator [Xanthobacteraceae bacterium]